MKKLYAILIAASLFSFPAHALLKAAGGTPGAVTSTGNFTTGNCVQFSNTGSSSAIISDTGSTCGGGGGGTPGGSSGQVQFNSSGSFGGFTLSGDCTLVASTGAITCTKTSGNAFASVATSGSASDLGSGTLPAARLPAPTASTFGGVQSFASASHNFLTGLNTSGVFLSAQPACGDLSDSSTGCSTTVGTLATLNTINNSNWSGTALSIGNGGTGQITASTAFNALSPLTTGGDILFGSVGGVGTRLAANSTGTNKYLQSVSSGNPLWSQVAFSDLSGVATGAQLPNPSSSTLGGVQSFASATNNFLTGLTTSGVFISARPSASNLSDGTTGSGAVVLVTSPTMVSPVVGTQLASDNSTKAASTQYVTSAINTAIAGVNPAVAVVVATTAASDTSGLTYSNGVSGIGATFTGSNNTALTIDGVTLTSLNQRVLVKNDTQSPSGAFNGVYYLTQLQTAILPPILTRALDYDMPSDINSTGAIPVTSGTVNGSTTWVITSTVNTVGTDPLTFTQFSVNPTTIITTSTSAGGDLSGTYPNPTVAKINGATLGTTTATSGNLLVAGGSSWATTALSGGATMLSTGVVTLGNPGASTKGGVQSFASASNAFLTGLTTGGVLLSARPSCADLSNSAASCSTDATNAGNITAGNLPANQLPTLASTKIWIGDTANFASPQTLSGGVTMTNAGVVTLGNPGASTLGGVNSFQSSANNFLIGLNTSGAFQSARPTCANLSNSAASCSTDATVATNITTGNLPLAQLPLISTSTVLGNTSGSSGAPTAITASNILDFVSSSQGDILFRSASTWQVLQPGISGQALETQGASANPVWATLSGTGTVSSIIFGSGVTGGTVTTTGTVTLDVTHANTWTGTQTFASAFMSTGFVESNVFAIGNSGTSKALNNDNGPKQSITISGAVALTLTTPTHPGSTTYVITMDGTGHIYSISGCKWPGGTAITYSTAINKVDIISILYDGSNFYCMGGAAFS